MVDYSRGVFKNVRGMIPPAAGTQFLNSWLFSVWNLLFATAERPKANIWAFLGSIALGRSADRLDLNGGLWTLCLPGWDRCCFCWMGQTSPVSVLSAPIMEGFPLFFSQDNIFGRAAASRPPSGAVRDPACVGRRWREARLMRAWF